MTSTPINASSVSLLYDGAPISRVRKWYRDLKRAASLHSLPNTETVRGPAAVRNNLIAGLQTGGYAFKVSPARELMTPWVGVLSDPIGALPWAIQAKRSGKIRKLVAGPNLVLTPDDHNAIITDPAIDIVVTPSRWVSDVYRVYAPELSGRLREWAVGVDEAFWSPVASNPEYDFLILNKIIGEEYAQHLKTITHLLAAKNLKYRILNYGEFTQSEYRVALQAARAMIYIGATESQGVSLFEAWSCNVPTLVRACDIWEYNRFRFPASAAPYLTDACGLMFALDNFQTTLHDFLENAHRFTPREYILANFTLEHSAKKYLAIFQAI